MSADRQGRGFDKGCARRRWSLQEARQALRSLCPQALLNWREARFYGRYGEVELHLLEFLCSAR